MKLENSSATDILQHHDIRPSAQRVAIMDYLLKHSTHPTVEEVYKDLVTTMPSLCLTTCYNTLKLLSQKGAAQMITIDDRKVCYDADTSLHAHFYCQQCGRVYDIFTPEEGEEAFQKFKLGGHEVHEVHRYYKGICSLCLKN